MRFTVFIILFALFFPLFGKILPVVSSLPYHFANYSIVVVGFVLFWILVIRPRKIQLNAALWSVYLFALYFVALHWFKGISSGLIQESVSRAQGVTLGFLVLLFVIYSGVLRKQQEFFRMFAVWLGILLILQTAVSAYESITGTLLGEYEIQIYGFTEGRDILEVLGESQMDLLGFRIPFPGLLGTHNTFGNMLIFYNLIFISQYLATGERIFQVFLLVVLFAAIGNTTRASLATILLTDVIILALRAHNKSLRRFLIALLVLISVGITSFLLVNVERFFPTSDTILYRTELWNYLLRHVLLKADPRWLIFGLSPEELRMVGVGFTGRMLGSYENQFFALLLYSGLIGLGLFCYAFIIQPLRPLRGMDDQKKIIFRLFALNIGLCGWTLDVHLHYSSFVLIIMIYLYCVGEFVVPGRKSIEFARGVTN
jgi:hypothetical protein